MRKNTTRRRWLAVCGLSLAGGLAGCSSDEDGDEGSQSTDTTPGEDDGSETDSQGHNGESSQTDSQSQDTDSEDASGDHGEATDDDNGETNDRDQDTGESSESVILSETLNWGQSYIIEIDFSGAQSGTVTQTVHEGDNHIVADFGGVQGESYSVDGTEYEVVGGQCLIRSDSNIADQTPDLGDPSGGGPDIEPTETTTVDSEPVYVFDMPSQENARWYVSTNTGYPVRFETEVFTARFHSWGETEPISPPDMNCREV